MLGSKVFQYEQENYLVLAVACFEKAELVVKVALWFNYDLPESFLSLS